MSQKFSLKKYLPVLVWAPHYGRQQFGDDAVAAIIVGIMVVPQALA